MAGEGGGGRRRGWEVEVGEGGGKRRQEKEAGDRKRKKQLKVTKIEVKVWWITERRYNRGKI